MTDDRQHRAGSFDTIPVVSFAAWTTARSIGDGAAVQRFADELVGICHRVGFLLLTDHGFDDEFLARYFAALEQFFALPTSTKEAIDKALSPHFRGWERVGSELTDNRIDYREQLDLSTENEPFPSGAEPAYLCIDGPNQWPQADTLPGFREIVTEFMTRAANVADELMAAISLGLGLESDHLHRAFGERRHSLMKLVSYPPTPPGQAGVNAHHDAGFLTVLAQHNIGGLQALNPDGQWIDVPPTPGTLVINLGEILQAMSGNYVVATTHRVITTEARVSSAYFHGPDLRAPLTPLPLAARFHDAVAASERHRNAGFMAKRDELLAGESGTSSASASTFGQQLWNYYQRSYPANVARHYGAATGTATAAGTAASAETATDTAASADVQS